MSSSLACSRTYSSYVSVEAGVPADHPIRRLRILVDTILRELSDLLDTRYADAGRPSIPSERILRASRVQVVYSVRSERLRRVVRSRHLARLGHLGLSGLQCDPPGRNRWVVAAIPDLSCGECRACDERADLKIENLQRCCA